MMARAAAGTLIAGILPIKIELLVRIDRRDR